MWKVLFTILNILWMISSTNSIEFYIYCDKYNGCSASISQSNPSIPIVMTQPNEDITIYGLPSNYVNNTVSSMKFDGIRLPYIPTNVFKIFPNLYYFQMQTTSSLTLFKDSFTNCQNLASISITNTRMFIIPEGFAQTCSNILWIYWQRDHIAKIDRNAFVGLKSLSKLDLSNNIISCLPYDLFQNTPNLSEIDLSNNKISSVDKDLFKNLKNLYLVNLSYNIITVLPAFDLTNTAISNYAPGSSGIRFNLSYNQIMSMSPDLCSMLTSRPSNIVDNINFVANPCTNYMKPEDTWPIGYASKFDCAALSKLHICLLNWKPMTYAPTQC